MKVLPAWRGVRHKPDGRSFEFMDRGQQLLSRARVIARTIDERVRRLLEREATRGKRGS